MMKQSLASIPSVKLLYTSLFLSYHTFITVTQGLLVHQAVSPARSRKLRAAAGRSIDDRKHAGAAFKVSSSFHCHGPPRTGIQRPVFKIEPQKNKKDALVKAHGRTEMYVIVLATDRAGYVDVFQRMSCVNHLRVDTKRRSEAQELHSISTAHN